MRRPELDALLTGMLAAQPGISDLLFAVGRPLQVEADGELHEVLLNPPIAALTPFQTEQIALNLIGDNRRLMRELLKRGACDCSYALAGHARFRANVYRQCGNFGIVMRRAQAEMPSVESLGLPAIVREIARERHGLVLVTGATGSGKTTTLAAILNEINQTRAVHVVTLEDPVEFLHTHQRATFTQRELGADFEDFTSGLRSALRQAPKVILVGEIRDRATVEIALTAAETGHLVLSSLHTINAGQTVNRLAGMFELAEETQLRLRLADTLRYVVSQRLVPRISGGRHLVQEIMGANLRVREAVALGETEGRSYYDIIEASSTYGWKTFDQGLIAACLRGEITEETADLYATHKGRITRALDRARKEAGAAVASSGLRLDVEPAIPAMSVTKR